MTKFLLLLLLLPAQDPSDAERLAREREQDAAELKRRLESASELVQSCLKDKGPGSARTSGTVWKISTRPLKGGSALMASHTDFLDIGDFHTEMSFDLAVTDLDGKELAIERCGICSPKRVFVPGQTGKIRVRVKGVHVWFSPYVLDFDAPKDGDQKKVGDCSITVQWPELKVASTGAWPQSVVRWTGKYFSYGVKAGVPFPPSGSAVIGGGKGGGFSFRSDRWCGCEDGPKPWVEKPAPERIREWTVSGGEKYHRIDQVAKIRYRFQKPVEDPFDFTVEIDPKDR